MEYFVSHVGYIAIAAGIVALVAVVGWYFSMKNEEAKRKKIEDALRKADEIQAGKHKDPEK